MNATSFCLVKCTKKRGKFWKNVGDYWHFYVEEKENNCTFSVGMGMLKFIEEMNIKRMKCSHL